MKMLLTKGTNWKRNPKGDLSISSVDQIIGFKHKEGKGEIDIAPNDFNCWMLVPNGGDADYKLLEKKCGDAFDKSYKTMETAKKRLRKVFKQLPQGIRLLQIDIAHTTVLDIKGNRG